MSWRQPFLRRLYDKGKIVIISPDAPFNPEYQIEPDAINLRLHPLAMRIRGDVSNIDTLEANTPTNYFEPHSIQTEGLLLAPGELVFGKTLETVVLHSKNHLGLVFGRRT